MGVCHFIVKFWEKLFVSIIIQCIIAASIWTWHHIKNTKLPNYILINFYCANNLLNFYYGQTLTSYNLSVIKISFLLWMDSIIFKRTWGIVKMKFCDCCCNQHKILFFFYYLFFMVLQKKKNRIWIKHHQN